MYFSKMFVNKKIQKACICKTKLRLPESNARIDVFVLIIVHLFVFLWRC